MVYVAGLSSLLVYVAGLSSLLVYVAGLSAVLSYLRTVPRPDICTVFNNLVVTENKNNFY